MATWESDTPLPAITRRQALYVLAHLGAWCFAVVTAYAVGSVMLRVLGR